MNENSPLIKTLKLLTQFHKMKDQTDAILQNHRFTASSGNSKVTHINSLFSRCWLQCTHILFVHILLKNWSDGNDIYYFGQVPVLKTKCKEKQTFPAERVLGEITSHFERSADSRDQGCVSYSRGLSRIANDVT